jgi:molybdopterin-containing oxidoreductase family iron-sulfur binding subunit
LTWDQVDQEVGSALTASRSVALVTPSLLSPSTRALIGDFGKKFSRFKQVEFSTAGNDSLFKAQELNYGTAVIPSYRFDRADVVVSFGADFLGTWLSPSEFSNQWSKTRQLKSKDSGLSKLYVVESTLSLTGSNADERIAVDSGDEFVLALALAHELIVKKGLGSFAANLKNELQTAAPKNLDSAVAKKVSEMANHLASNQGRSLVIAGGVAAQSKNALELQVLVNAINSALGNEGHTVDGVVSPFGYQKTSAADLKSLIAEMSEGKIDTLILYRSNLAYHLPLAFGFKEALKKVKTVVVISDREDETSLLADYTLADHHYLENWGDVEFKKGTVSLQQPALAPIHNTRSFQDSLIGLGQLKGSGSLVGNDWHEKLQSYWKNNFYKETKPISVFGTFEQFWEKCLKEGVLVLNRSMPKQTVRSFNFNGSVHFSSATSNQQEAVKLTLYHKVGMGDGTQANNAWIQEFPEPVSTATWDNYLNIGPSFAKKLGIENDDIVEVKSKY